MPGFVRTNAEVKMLALYVLSKVEQPLTFDELLQGTSCDPGVDYFSLKQSVDELIQQENVSIQKECYSILPRGRSNCESVQNQLPSSVVARCEEVITQLRKKYDRESQAYAQSSVVENPDSTCMVRLTVGNPQGVLMELKYLVANVTQAEREMSAFHKNPTEFYNELLGKVRDFTQDSLCEL